MTDSPSKPLAWVTGARGLIGSYLVQTAPRFVPGWRVRALARADLDLLDRAAVEREFKKDRPGRIIHCAAVATAAAAQQNPDLARRVNIEATRWLAELAADLQFVFFSTDLIFDGRKGNYAEGDAPNPLHLYGETKAAAERVVLKNLRHLVIRTSLNGGLSRAGDRGFNEQLRRAWRAGRALTLFTDEFRCPIFAGETARAVWELAERNGVGVFHVAGAEKLSRWQIGRLLAARWPELHPKMAADSVANFQGPPRAPDTSLDISKAQALLSKPLPGLSQWLATHPDEPF